MVALLLLKSDFVEIGLIQGNAVTERLVLAYIPTPYVN